MVAMLLLGSAVAGVVVWKLRPAAALQVTRFAVTLAQGQHPHGSIVVVQHFALGGLADQFFQGGLYPLRRFRHDLALGGGRQRDPQASLQPLQPIPGKSAAIAEQRHHTRRRRIIPP